MASGTSVETELSVRLSSFIPRRSEGVLSLAREGGEAGPLDRESCPVTIFCPHDLHVRQVLEHRDSGRKGGLGKG